MDGVIGQNHNQTLKAGGRLVPPMVRPSLRPRPAAGPSIFKSTPMKNIKLLSLVFVAAVLCSPIAPAQTNTPVAAAIPGLPQLGGTAGAVGDYLAANTNALTATNWTIAPYASYAKDLKNPYGGGLAAVYYLTPYIGTQIRAQYLDTGLGNKFWLPNGTLTLQSVYQPLGASIPITLRPVIEAGIATDLSGHMYAIAGAGAELDMFTGSATSKIRRVSLFYGVEQWQGQSQKFSVQQLGAAVNFNLGGKGFLGLF
jgi:hypothetical protein